MDIGSLVELFLPIVKSLLSNWEEYDTKRYLKLALEIEDSQTGYYLRLAVETDSSRAASAISEGIRELLNAQALVLVERMKMIRSNERETYMLA